MAVIIPTDENTLNAELKLMLNLKLLLPLITLASAGLLSAVASVTSKVPTYEAYQTSQLKSETPVIAKVSYTPARKCYLSMLRVPASIPGITK